MSKSTESSKENLIDKIKFKTKMGNISLILLAICYIALNIVEILVPNFGSMGEFMIFLLLTFVAGLILDGYKLIIELLEIIDIKEDNK